MQRLNEIAILLKPMANNLGFSRLIENLDLNIRCGDTRVVHLRLYVQQIYAPVDALGSNSRVRRVVDFVKPDCSKRLVTLDQLVISQDLRWWRWRTEYHRYTGDYFDATTSSISPVVAGSDLPKSEIWIDTIDQAVRAWIGEAVDRRIVIQSELRELLARFDAH
jgi:hypothetical protein